MIFMTNVLPEYFSSHVQIFSFQSFNSLFIKIRHLLTFDFGSSRSKRQWSESKSPKVLRIAGSKFSFRFLGIDFPSCLFISEGVNRGSPAWIIWQWRQSSRFGINAYRINCFQRTRFLTFLMISRKTETQRYDQGFFIDRLGSDGKSIIPTRSRDSLFKINVFLLPLWYLIYLRYIFNFSNLVLLSPFFRFIWMKSLLRSRWVTK